MSHINIFDAVVIGVMALSCIFAFFRGLVREVLSLIAWIGAGVVTIYYFHPVVEKLQQHFKSETVAAGVAAISIYVGALIGFAILNIIIVRTIKQGEGGGMLDNTLGLFFGALRGAFILSLGYFMLTVALPENEHPEWLEKAVTAPYVERGAKALAQMAPDYLRELSSFQKRATEEVQQEQNSNYNDAQPSAGDDNSGYSRRSGQQLNRLIDNADRQ